MCSVDFFLTNQCISKQLSLRPRPSASNLVLTPTARPGVRFHSDRVRAFPSPCSQLPRGREPGTKPPRIASPEHVNSQRVIPLYVFQLVPAAAAISLHLSGGRSLLPWQPLPTHTITSSLSSPPSPNTQPFPRVQMTAVVDYCRRMATWQRVSR